MLTINQAPAIKTVTHVTSIMPAMQETRVATTLLAANVAAAALNCTQHSLEIPQAIKLTISKHGLDKHPRIAANGLDELVETITITTIDVINTLREQGYIPTRDEALYTAIERVLVSRLGQRTAIVGWLEGKRTMCLDKNDAYRPVRLTGGACPSCSINPSVESLSGTHERCLDQQVCGWAA